jgi:F-type H+-transporting ATPase subunit epsilon
MNLQIITPEEILFSGQAEMVTVPGSEGEFGVLTGHAPLISTLRSGEVVVQLENGKEERIAIVSGVAEVTPERCTLLIEQASPA